MGGPYARKKGQKTPHRDRLNKTKNYSYPDQADANTRADGTVCGDPDLPGEGHFFCTVCCRFFADKESLEEHETKNKVHKRKRKRAEKEEEYTVGESERAGGVGGSYAAPPVRGIKKIKKQKMEAQ